MRGPRGPLSAAALALLVVLCAACGGSPASKPASPATFTAPEASSAAGPLSTSQAPERERVRVMYGSISGSMAPLWIADDKQLFKKYGLDVDVQYAETTIGATALVSGEAQFNLNDGVSGIHAIAAGSPLKMIATFGTKNNYAIVVRPEITSPENLRGKTIALLRPGDTTDVSARIALKPYGLNLGEDVQPLQVGNSPTRLSALLTGQVAAALLAEAFVDQAVAQGMRVLISLEKEDRPYLTTVVLTPTEFGRANPNTVLAFLKTMIEATKFYSDPANRAEVLPLLARQLKVDPSDPTVADAYEYFHSRLQRDPIPDREGAEAILDALRGIDPAVYQALTVDDVFESSYTHSRSGRHDIVDGLEPPGVPGQPVQEHRLLPKLAQALGEGGLELVEVGEQPVGELGAEVPEDLLGRVQLGRVGRQPLRPTDPDGLRRIGASWSSPAR